MQVADERRSGDFADACSSTPASGRDFIAATANTCAHRRSRDGALHEFEVLYTFGASRSSTRRDARRSHGAADRPMRSRRGGRPTLAHSTRTSWRRRRTSHWAQPTLS
jgi:hypothetical protein